MLDGVDRAGELLDGHRQGRSQAIQDQRRRADTAELQLVRLQGHVAQGEPEVGGEANGGGRLEVAVQAAAPQFVGEGTGRRPEVHVQRAVNGRTGSRGAGLAPLRLALDGGMCHPEGSSLGIDGPGRLVPEQVADHRGQHEGEPGMHPGNGDDVQGVREPGGTGICDDHRCGPVRTVDGHLLGDVVSRGTHEAGGADQDHRLGRQVDVLLVLGGIRRYRLVAELRELDPDLPGRDQVRTAAHDGPVPARWGVPLGDLGDPIAHGQHLDHGVGQVHQARQQPGSVGRPRQPGCIGHRHGQEHPGHHLCVEGLGRGHAHLHVPPIGCVQDAIGTVHQVAVAAVHDRHHTGPAGPHQVDGPVRVGGGPRLANRHDHHVGHVRREPEPGQLGGRHGLHHHGRTHQLHPQRSGNRHRRHRCGPLADHQQPADDSRCEVGPQADAEGRLAQPNLEPCIHVTREAPPEGRADRPRRLPDLLQEEVGMVSPVDVTCRDLGPDQVVRTDRKVTSVIGVPADPLDGPRQGGVQLHDLSPAGSRFVRIGRRLAVHPEEVAGHLHHPVRLAGHHEGILGEAHVEALAAAPQGQQQAIRCVADHRPDGQRTLEGAHGPPEGLTVVMAGRQVGRTQRRHHLGVGRDLGHDAEALRDDQVGMVVHVAVLYRHDHGRGTTVGTRGIQRMGVRFGDEAHAGPTGVAQQ